MRALLLPSLAGGLLLFQIEPAKMKKVARKVWPLTRLPIALFQLTKVGNAAGCQQVRQITLRRKLTFTARTLMSRKMLLVAIFTGLSIGVGAAAPQLMPSRSSQAGLIMPVSSGCEIGVNHGPSAGCNKIYTDDDHVPAEKAPASTFADKAAAEQAAAKTAADKAKVELYAAKAAAEQAAADKLVAKAAADKAAAELYAAKVAAKKAAAEKLAAQVAADKSVAATAACPGNANALGTSRVLTVGADEFARVGVMQYGHTLPLADHEVVLTFDDGPLPPYTDQVLAALAAECVKATYFMVGRMANAYPDAARRVYNDGHTIGTHSQHHPYTFASMTPQSAAKEINDGFASVGAALGDPNAVAPFFRFPGLMHVKSVENYLASRSIMTWSADLDADDWHKIGALEVLRRAISRLEARGRGMLLLHDIQPATALMLPTLLKELKSRGYRIVQVVPSGAERPKTVPVASSSQSNQAKQGWPRVAGVRTDDIK